MNTGYGSPELLESMRARFPAGRCGEPDDPARLIAWLATDEARWVTGQIIHSEGGVRRQLRWRPPVRLLGERQEAVPARRVFAK